MAAYRDAMIRCGSPPELAEACEELIRVDCGGTLDHLDRTRMCFEVRVALASIKEIQSLAANGDKVMMDVARSYKVPMP